MILEYASAVHEAPWIFIWERSWAHMRYIVTLRIRETVKCLFRPAQGIFNYQRQDKNANVAKAWHSRGGINASSSLLIA